ncbi:M24 family metallopeptidase [Companilactobacillus zhachilii]|uniref:M24 family metallopeptidase n=1 Tax=Companilactobacillus zhachilii TaxID=2304606 RepID=UPI001921ED89|nr:M24 family metallopeptidase [Companilactobacillus zhachilii]MBL3530888.1 M24 family metallopeptidase [Companilactobacillus zhachilii]
MMKKVDKIRKLLDELDVDAIVINQKATKIYLDALTGSGVWIVLSKSANYQIMDGRYAIAAEPYKDRYKNIVTMQGGVFNGVLQWLKDNGIKKVAIETEMPYSQYHSIEQLCDVNPLNDAIPLIRSVKDEDEVQLVQNACSITDQIFSELLKHIYVGMTEKQVVGEVFKLVYDFGAEGVSFDPVISSGPRTAMPHGRASDRIIQTGDFLLLDFGIVKEGYQSDMTRTVSVGEMTDQFKNLYETLLPIQQATIQQFVPGKKGKEIHKYASKKIEQSGYGEYFTHGLGHGLGIGGGERPLMNATSEDVLQSGMIGTCEPGIYLPGVGGIRIEDDVLVMNEKPVSLTKTTHELLIVGN